MWFTVPVNDRALEGWRAEKTVENLEAEVVHLVRLLTLTYPSAISAAVPSRTGFDREMDWFVYVALPTGQVSWHIKHEYVGLFSHVANLPISPWDGHGQEDKWIRITTAIMDGTVSRS